MAIRLSRRAGTRQDAGPRNGIIQAERAAVAALAATLRRLATELPRESPLAGELAKVAQSIDVAGVLGVYALDALTREPPERNRIELARAA
jgi:hypothetical protein